MPRVVSKEDSKLRLAADGGWWHDGERASHERLARFLHRQIRRDAHGHYLYNSFVDPERGKLEEHVYFEVEDTAFFVERVTEEADGLWLELNDGGREPLDPTTLASGAEGRLYCEVRGGERARFGRHALVQIEPWLDEDEHGPLLRLGAERYRIRVS